MRLNLRAKFLIPSFSLIVAGISLLVTLNYFNVKATLTNTAREDLLLLTKAYAADVSGDIEAKARVLMTWSKNPVLAAAAQGSKIDAANAYLIDYTQAVDGILLSSCYDATGTNTASSMVDSIGKTHIPDRDYFKAAMQGKTNIVGKAIISRSANAPVVVVAQPIPGENNKPLGLVNAIIDLTTLTKQVSSIKIGTTGYLYLLDQDGNVLAHPNRDLLLKDDLVKTPWGKHILGVTGSEVYEYDDATGPKMAAVVKDKFTGWTVVAMAPLEDMAASLRAVTIKNVTVASVTMLLLMLAITAAVGGFILKPLKKTVNFASEVAEGHLEQSLELDSKDELGTLAAALRRMLTTLKGKIAAADELSAEAMRKTEEATHARKAAEEATNQAKRAKSDGMVHAANTLEGIVEVISSASDQLSRQIDHSNQGAETQSRRISETATAMEEMSASVLEVAKNASQAAETADNAKKNALEGAEVVSRVVERIDQVQAQSQSLKEDMATLGNQAQGIGQIMNVISDIADQTNLLALNAAIEAARAGDAGRGFAVVADEVRKLAEKTMTATKEVGNAIQGIQQGTQKNVENVDKSAVTIGEATILASDSGKALEQIVRLVEMASDQVRSIATASEEQSSASEEINRSIGDVNQISMETAEAMQQSSQAVNELTGQTQRLREIIEAMQSEGEPKALGT
ncbi:MAG: methyl-accepting chemotaxis protein [Solidesulfovibrio sp.]